MAALRTVLGLWDGHDAGVALIHNGKLQFALSEERLARQKRASGFPYLALEACLDYCNLNPADIDSVAVPGQYGRLLHRAGDRVYRKTDPNRDPLGLPSILVRNLEIGLALTPGLKHIEAMGSRSILVSRLRRLGIVAPISWIDHHDAHAMTARLGGLKDAMVVTMDAYGDGICGTVNGPGEGRESIPSPSSSVALVYAAVTRMLGFSEGDEGKVMGLAAHGNPKPLQPWFRKVLGYGVCDPSLGGKHRRQTLLEHSREDVAAALQHRVEEVVTGWISARRDNRRKLAVAGGLFANVSLNGKLAKLFDEFYVFPHMGDGGLCVGAAATLVPDLAFGLPFYGPLYSEPRVRAAIRRTGLAIETVQSPELELLNTIEEGGIAARFVGRSEFGPRALGHRSILMRADRPILVDTLNRKLGRDEFMPFAPIRRHGAGSPTMTVVVDADKTLKESCHAAVHIDDTARTQIVDPNVDSSLYAMLEAAEARGMPALINTSFNRHGEPIVETPEHALNTFLGADLDIMQLGPFIVRRPQ